MARKTYTITVILKAFFTDCRAQAKIFISEDIQTVLDLENKISRIFGIKNFHLLSNENLLPSCEDIRLLDKGDIISVLPNDSHTNLLLPERFYSTIDEPIRCKKKKRQHLDDECPIKEKKSMKEKKEATLCDDEKFDDLTQCKTNKKFEDFSNKKKKEKKCRDNAYINQISQPGQSLSSSAPHSIGKIKDPNLHVEKDKKFSLIDKKVQESVNVEEEKMGGDQCIKVNSEKENNINLLSHETSGAVSDITSVANNHRLHNSPTKFKKTTNKQLISSPNDSFLKMIVDSTSSSSDSEIEETISTTKESISKTNQSKFLGQSINKTETNKNVIEESSETYGFDKVPQKGCSFYHLPTKKGNLWSTSPLQKTINHVNIEKVPLTLTDTDLSKFVFNPCNIGVIPVPNHETTNKHIMNDFSTSDSNMVNLSQHSITSLSTQNASMEEISASACDELNTTFSPYSNNITDKEIVQQNHQTSNESLKFIPSILNLKNILKSEEVAPIVSNKVSVDSNDSENFEETIIKKRFVMNKWKKKVLKKFDDATQNSLSNQDDTSSIVNKVLEAKENEQIGNMTNQPPQISPKVVKLNSYKMRNNTTNNLGINHYMKLLNKIDWDLSKSISNVNPDEIQSPPENTKLVEQVQSPLCAENKMHSLESINLSRSISNLNIDEILSKSGNEKLVGQVESPLYVQNKMKYLENIDVSNYISNPDEVQSQSGNENVVGQVESPLYVQNKMEYLENIDVYKYISNPDEAYSQSGNEELVRQEKAPLYVENMMNSLESIDMSSPVSSTVIDLATKRKRKRKHKKKIRADTPATVKSCHFLPSKQHTLVKGTPKLHIRFESDDNDYLHEDEDEISANFENSSKNVKVLQDVCLDLSRNEGNICLVGSISTERDIEGNNPNACILSIDIMDASKQSEKEVIQDVCLDLSKNEGNIHHVGSISTERDIKGNNPNACFLSIGIMDASKPTEKEFEIVSGSSMNLVELHEKNEDIVSNECFESILKDCRGKEKNLQFGFQKSALDYTNGNLSSYENTYIAKSSSSSPKLGIISPEEALARAKVALLKAVGFLSPDQSSAMGTYKDINADIQNTDISVDGAINLSGSGVNKTQRTKTFL